MTLSRRILPFLLVIYLVLAPRVVLAEQPVLRIGLETLPGPWAVSGPATIRVHKSDFTVETIELHVGEQALVTECFEQHSLNAGTAVQQAEFLAATLRGCGFASSIRKRGADYLIEVPLNPDAATKLISHGFPLVSSGANGCLHVQTGGRNEAVLAAEVVASTQDEVQINSRFFRGATSFAFFSPVRPGAILSIGLDQYLQGVVPEEMPASWPLSALQAQAVAARTYALKNMGKHAQVGYDLCDTTHCQAFGGVAVECERSNQAVTTTSGEVMTWQSELIDAVYHSHAGGYAVSSLHAWGNQVPYLVSQPIPEEPPYIWSLQLTTAELEQLLSQRLPSFYIHGLQVAEYGEGRRVLSVGVSALIGPELVQVKDFRLALGVNRLRSSCFTVTAYSIDGRIMEQGPCGSAIRRATLQPFELAQIGGCFADLLPPKPEYYLFHGTGYGHGVGMSQWGAFGMANLGYSYKDILYRFYRGIELVEYR